MTTFKKSSFKRLGALVMAMAMVCAMAISASALDAGSTYKPVLTSDIPNMPHGLTILANKAAVNPADTVTIELQAMQVGDVTGTVKDASSNTEGYDAHLSADGKYLIVTCPEDTDYGDFSVSITFYIERSDGRTHNMPATLTLTEYVAED